MVVMEREEYEKKSEELLSESTYSVLPSDPTTKQKNKLIGICKTMKSEGGINDNIYKRLYPTGASTPPPQNTTAYPKCTKRGSP